MRWVRALRLALRSALSPTLGADPREPVLAWALRPLPWRTGRGRLVHGATALISGAAAGFLIIQHSAGSRGGPSGDTAVLAAALARMLLDTMTLLRAADRPGFELRSGRWDLLRLTDQGEGAVLRALYAAAHAGVWRLTLLMLGLQTGLLAGLALAVRTAPGERPAILALFTAATVAFGIELVLRPRAVVAIAFATSAAAPSAAGSVALGGIALVFYWAGQAAAGLIGLLAFTFIFGWFTAILSPVVFGALAATFVAVPAIAVTLFLQRVSLRRLALAVIRHDLGV